MNPKLFAIWLRREAENGSKKSLPQNLPTSGLNQLAKYVINILKHDEVGYGVQLDFSIEIQVLVNLRLSNTPPVPYHMIPSNWNVSDDKACKQQI